MDILRSLRAKLSPPDIAIDLGTANTRVYARGRGMIVERRSILVSERSTGGRLFPVRGGAIVDVGAAASLIQPSIQSVQGHFWGKPRALACIFTGAKSDDREALVEASRHAGAGAVQIVAEPLAAAIGAGLDISSSQAQMLVDLGDGVTDVAVIRGGVLVTAASLDVACSDLRRAVADYIIDSRGILVEDEDADRLVREVASNRASAAAVLRVSGHHRRTQRAKTISVASDELADVIAVPSRQIAEFARAALRRLCDHTAAEVIETGLCVTGGGAQLDSLVSLLAQRTCLDVRCPEDPMRSTIRGARAMLDSAAATHLWDS